MNHIYILFQVLLTGFKNLPPLFEATPNVIPELTITSVSCFTYKVPFECLRVWQILGDIYKHAGVLSVKIEDHDAFKRDFFKLKPCYTDDR